MGSERHGWLRCVMVVLAIFVGSTAFGQTEAATETLQPLLDVLEDPEARAILIEALEAQTVPDDPAADTPSDQTLAAQLATATISFAGETWSQISRAVQDIGRLTQVPEVLTRERRAEIWPQLRALILTVLVTVAIYRLFRHLSRRIHLRAAREAVSFQQLALTFMAQFGLRLLSVVLAWVGGYGVAAIVSQGDDGVAITQALYLNAFLVFGLFSLVLSILVSRHPEDLTFAQLPSATAAAIYRRVRLVFGVLCYGVIAVVPIVQDWTNFVIARSVRTLIVILGAILAVWAVRKIASTLRRERAEQVTVVQEDDTIAGSIATHSHSLWDRIWPTLAIIYILIATVVALANPNLIIELVGRATVFSGAGLLAMLFGLRMLSQVSNTTTLTLPGGLDDLLPTLSQRLVGFVKPAFVVLGLALVAGALMLILEGWRLINLSDWLAGGGTELMWRLASILLIVIALILGWSLLSSWIDQRLSENLPESRQVSARSRTLLALFRNAVSIALVIFGGMTVLSELGIDIAPLLAGAGVIGLAIGFGAQKLVQDIITGIFIQLENAINEGDVVTVAGITGGVEKLTIRSVGIRDLSGVYHLIPFSAVDTVGNYMRRFAYHVEVVGVAYDTPIEQARAAMEDAFATLRATEHGREILDDLEYHGVVSLGDSSVNIRARIKTRPGSQWAVGRAYTQAVKEALDAAGIEIPFPHRELKMPEALVKLLSGAQDAAS